MAWSRTSAAGRSIRRLAHGLPLILASLCAVCLSKTVHGQWAISIERPWQSAVTKKELGQIATLLQFSDDQRITLQQLAADHDLALAEVISEGKKFEQESKPDPTAPRDDEFERAEVVRLKKLAEYADKFAELDQGFFDNLAAICNSDQEPLWPVYMRDRRWRTLEACTFLMAPGSKVNLNAVVGELDLVDQQRDQLADIMYEYYYLADTLIDPIIDSLVRYARLGWQQHEWMRRRNEVLQRAADEQDLVKYEKVGIPWALKSWRAIYKAQAPQVAMRELNKEYVEKIAETLPPDTATKFRNEVRSRMYLTWENETEADRVAERVLKSASLGEDQRKAIEQIVADYRIALEKTNVASGQIEEKQFKSRFNYQIDFEAMKEFDRQYGEEMKERSRAPRRLANETIEKVKAVLNEEQKSDLFRTAASKPSAESRPVVSR